MTLEKMFEELGDQKIEDDIELAKREIEEFMVSLTPDDLVRTYSLLEQLDKTDMPVFIINAMRFYFVSIHKELAERELCRRTLVN